MNNLKQQIAALPTSQVGSCTYLSYRAVTNQVAAYLFPERAVEQVGEQDYQRILERADAICRELGYTSVEKLTPPSVPFPDMGLYWAREPEPDSAEPDEVIIASPGRVEELRSGRLLDARLTQLGLDEVTRQHFRIPVTASDGVLDLMHRAVASDWPNDFKGVWYDICGMSIAGGKDVSPTERLFAVIIRGVGKRRYWQMKITLKHDHLGAAFLFISLADEHQESQLFELGHVVMTPGAAALNVDFSPYLAMHSQGQWGQLDRFDWRQNDRAVKEGLRILSAYDVPLGNGETERIWIITEADRSATTLLTPREY